MSPVLQKYRIMYVALLLGMFILGYILRPIADHPNSAPQTASVRAKPGPWGDLEITPIAISCTDEYLRVEQTEKEPTRWIFKNRSRDDLATYFDSRGLPKDEKDALLSPAILEAASDGVALSLSGRKW